MFKDLQFKFSLGSDNHAGIHPKVMQAMQAANRGHAHAYGMDELCALTAGEFKRLFGPEVQPEYVFTGTAANVLSLAPMLRSFEATFCSDLAHLNVDECGAPEKFLGGKLIPLPSSPSGKITPESCEPWLDRYGDQHFAQPRCVSLTQPNELGVCYTLAELQSWREFTRKRNLMLHIDGARLANAAAFLNVPLRALTTDIGADVVSFGGTKNGLLAAEAVLLFSERAKTDFKFYRKQGMQLSSKTRFLAAQFYAYLKDDLWLEIARHTTGHARNLASRLGEFKELQVAFPIESNAVFVQLPKAWIKPLRERFFFYVWAPDKNLCRWMISWDWTDDLTEQVVSALREVAR